jgi:hypothetical protein
MTTRPNHLGAALQRHRRADPLGGAGEANPGCAPKVRFAVDSPLEGAGFEPSVPRITDDGFEMPGSRA